ncbi:MAG TPA: riboflavin biosynthesis protein RibF [Planctomycetota bacterium]|nr:riboflavin biosynthesis protein RibF [Planctomycetota bacterium]
MRTYFGNETQPSERGAVLAIGTFDGVHRGHQNVLSALVAWGKEANAPTGAITFRDHPRKTLEGRSPDLVTTLEHRLVLFERLGLDFAWVLDFTPEISQLSARDFAKHFFVARLHARGLMMGFDSRFGCDRISHNSPGLTTIAQELGFDARCQGPVLCADGGAISSTKIREAIGDGRLRDAEAMLGRRVSVYGTVVRGDGRGRRLGYHTANLDLGREFRPPFGVYATIALLNNRAYGSVSNVGYRPTVVQPEPGAKPDLLVETHLFDFDGDLYDKKMEVQFIEKLRDERRFPDVQALVEQIKKDETKAREILRAQGVLK